MARLKQSALQRGLERFSVARDTLELAREEAPDLLPVHEALLDLARLTGDQELEARALQDLRLLAPRGR